MSTTSGSFFGIDPSGLPAFLSHNGALPFDDAAFRIARGIFKATSVSIFLSALGTTAAAFSGLVDGVFGREFAEAIASLLLLFCFIGTSEFSGWVEGGGSVTRSIVDLRHFFLSAGLGAFDFACKDAAMVNKAKPK